MQDEINTLSGDISGLNSSVGALARRCDSLETITTAQGVDINTLKQDVLDLREEDGLLQTQITDLDGYVATNTSNITTNTSNITSLQTYANRAMLRAMNCNALTPT